MARRNQIFINTSISICVGVELYINSSYSEIAHKCQSVELDCIINGQLDDKTVKNTYLHIHHNKGVNSNMSMNCHHNEKGVHLCQKTISPCNQTDNGMYSCTVKIDGNEFSSLAQDVQVDSNKIELIIILTSSIVGTFLVTILITLNIAVCINIYTHGRQDPHRRAGLGPQPPQGQQPLRGPQPCPGSQRQQPFRNRLNAQPTERDPLLGNESGIKRNPSNAHQKYILHSLSLFWCPQLC